MTSGFFDKQTNLMLVLLVFFVVFAILVLTQSVLNSANKPPIDLIVNG